MGQWKKIYNCLDGHSNYQVYSPGTKKGECKSPYVVVKDEGGGRYQNLSTRVDYYSILCYVPYDGYSGMEELISTVQIRLKELEPEIVCTNEITPSFYDDTIKAHMVSIMYSNYKKLTGIIR